MCTRVPGYPGSIREVLGYPGRKSTRGSQVACGPDSQTQWEARLCAYQVGASSHSTTGHAGIRVQRFPTRVGTYSGIRVPGYRVPRVPGASGRVREIFQVCTDVDTRVSEYTGRPTRVHGYPGTRVGASYPGTPPYTTGRDKCNRFNEIDSNPNTGNTNTSNSSNSARSAEAGAEYRPPGVQMYPGRSRSAPLRQIDVIQRQALAWGRGRY
eukprot:1803752-Rhodomonas_salina.1